MPQLMDPDAYAALAIDGELEVTRDGSIPALAERVGYRVVQPGSPSDIGVLATPQLADDSSLGGAPARPGPGAAALHARGHRRRAARRPAGLAGALAAGRRAAPFAPWRSAAGQPMPPHAEHPPLEFEPVFGAFERMAADIRSSQAGAGGGATPDRRRARHGGDRRRGHRPRRTGADRQPTGGGSARHRAGGRRPPAGPARRRMEPVRSRRAPIPRRPLRGRRPPSSRRGAGASRSGSPRSGPDVRGVVDRAQRRHRRLPRRAGAGLGRDGAPGGARDQEPADADAARTAAPAARLSRPARGLRPHPRGDGRHGCWRRSTGWTPSPGRSAGSLRRPTTCSRSTGSISAWWSVRWSSSTGWPRKAARCGSPATPAPTVPPVPTR